MDLLLSDGQSLSRSLLAMALDDGTQASDSRRTTSTSQPLTRRALSASRRYLARRPHDKGHILP